MNSAIFLYLLIVKYFDFSSSAGGFDLSLFNMHTYMRIRRYRILVIQISRPIKINVLSMFGSVAINNGKNVLPLYRTLLLVLQVSHVTFSEISAADQDGKLLATNWDVFHPFKCRF